VRIESAFDRRLAIAGAVIAAVSTTYALLR
jgi:hypothetical protein